MAIDVQAAANTARQLVQEAWNLQALLEVLDRIASDDHTLKEIAARIEANKALEASSRDSLAAALAEEGSAVQRAKDVYRERLEQYEGMLAAKQASIRALEQREAELTQSVQALERTCAEIRARLADAAA